MSDTKPVLIVGGGPTGMTAAMELSRFAAPVRIVDKLMEPPITSRALAVQARTLEWAAAYVPHPAARRPTGSEGKVQAILRRQARLVPSSPGFLSWFCRRAKRLAVVDSVAEPLAATARHAAAIVTSTSHSDQSRTLLNLCPKSSYYLRKHDCTIMNEQEQQTAFESIARELKKTQPAECAALTPERVAVIHGWITTPTGLTPCDEMVREMLRADGLLQSPQSAEELLHRGERANF